MEIYAIVDRADQHRDYELGRGCDGQGGKETAKIHQNIVVKVPDLRGTSRRQKTDDGERMIVNVTLCSSPTHALPAANAGVWRVPSCIGRFDNIDSKLNRVDPSDCDDRKPYDFKTSGLAASVRHPRNGQGGLGRRRYLYHVDRCVPRVHQAPMTDLGVNMFLAGWNAQFQKLPTVRKEILL